MKDPSGSIRAWLYTLLNTNISYLGTVIPIYSFAPKDAAKPYILLSEQSSPGEESVKDSYISNQQFTIEVWTSDSGNDNSYKAVNTISDSVMQLVRVRTSITISGYNVVSVTFDNAITDMLDFGTEIVAYKILYFTMIIEEN